MISKRRYLQKGLISLLLLGMVITLVTFPGCKGDQTNNLKVLPEKDNSFYQEITEASGIGFIHQIGDGHLSNLVESVGGGAAFLDFDQDGYIDLYISNGTYLKGLSEGEKPDGDPINRLYRNLGNGRFEDVTRVSGTGHAGYGMGMTVGDYDNNGFPDIYVSNYGANVLYRNNGDGSFTDVTDEAGIGGSECSVGAVWLDFDNNGWLDLYVGNYVDYDPDYGYFYAPDGFPGPLAYDGQADVLYRNRGNGTFDDVTREMGVYHPEGRAMGVGAADYDGDGYTDIFVANDHMVNYLWHNNEGKGFSDKGIMSGVAFNQAGEATISMSVDFGDYNNDGLLDLFISDDTYCSLYRNEGKGVFTDQSYPSGIAVAAGQHVGWSSSFLDYDNDGDVDILKVNGELKHLYGQEDQLFENIDGERFRDVSVDRGEYFSKEMVGRGACCGDYDNDGDMDIYIVNLNDRGVFLRNNLDPPGNWLLLKLEGISSNRDGLGCRVSVYSGQLVQTSVKRSTTGYLSQNDPRLHFGLGPYSQADSILIQWPSGKLQLLRNISAGEILTITEPE